MAGYMIGVTSEDESTDTLDPETVLNFLNGSILYFVGDQAITTIDVAIFFG